MKSAALSILAIIFIATPVLAQTVLQSKAKAESRPCHSPT
jgi:hypothetical protein